MNHIKGIMSLVIFVSVLIFTGCGSQQKSMLSKGVPDNQQTKAFVKYIKYLQAGDNESAFKMLYFKHSPESENIKAFEMAQKISNMNVKERSWIVTGFQQSDIITVLDVDITSVFNEPAGQKVKQKVQTYLINDNDEWRIIPGVFDERNKIFEKYSELKSDTLKLKRDKIYLYNEGKWVEKE